MRQRGFGKWRFIAHKQNVGFGFDRFKDMYILRLGFFQIGRGRWD